MAAKEIVTKVIDGDTFGTSRRSKLVRLADVDAPEKNQPGYKKATEALKKLILGEEVRVETVARDRYGRAVAKVYLGHESINKKMQKKLG
jgi:endonuclease YncB( thermonuclease family)